jgi:Putative Ig domain
LRKVCARWAERKTRSLHQKPQRFGSLGTIEPMRGGLILGAAFAAAIAVGAGSTAAGVTRASSIQHVTVIGDSVADGMAGDDLAVATLSQGIVLDLEVEPCRRVDQDSCPGPSGVRPPNVVTLVKSMGSKLGPNVVIAVGYNDFEDQYATNIETALAALKAAGVQRVWWLTLRAAHHGYLTMNDDITNAALQHPGMRVIDWNVYSRSHPDWFQPDGLHLLARGAEAMAGLIHKTLVADGIAAKPVRVATTTLPVAHRGKPYSAKLTAGDGVAPFAWSLLERAPKGLHLEASGAILGTPRVPLGRYTFNVRVKDSAASFATQRLTLRVASR